MVALTGGEHSVHYGKHYTQYSPPKNTPGFTPDMWFHLPLRVNTKCTIVFSMSHNEWLAATIRPDSIRAASQRIDLAPTTITRQLQRGGLSPEVVIALCRAYGQNPVDGLVETGFLRPHEAEHAGLTRDLGDATNRQLLDEILNRSDPEATELFGGEGNVIDLSPRFTTPAMNDDTPDAFVADHSPTEPEPGDDDYGPGA